MNKGPAPSLWPEDLRLRAQQAQESLKSCRLCARQCGADRLANAEQAWCELDARAWVYKELVSLGEEACISPTWLIDLSGCSLRCLFCTEWPHIVAPMSAGKIALEPEWFSRKWEQRHAQGIKTVSFVGGEPTLSIAAVLEALRAVEPPKQLPIVWNTNGLLSEQAYELLAGLVHTWIVDLKLEDGRWLGAGRLDYLETVSLWLDRIHADQHRYGHDLIIRHLVMPGQVELHTKPLLNRAAERWPESTLNLMTQYLPFGPALKSAQKKSPLRQLAKPSEITEAQSVASRHPGPIRVNGRIAPHL